MSQIINEPDFDDTLEALKNDIFATMNCIQVGKINKVNSNQTCEIMLQVKRRTPSGTVAYPILVDCPYFVLQGGGAYVDMPVKSGDYCIVLFNDRNIDIWWKTANVKEPRDRRKHSLSDGMALVGINPETSSLESDGQTVRILGTSGPGAELFAARKTDAVQSTAIDDAAFWSWVTTISAAVNALSSGSVPNVPVSLTGQITGGSTEVKIG